MTAGLVEVIFSRQTATEVRRGVNIGQWLCSVRRLYVKSRTVRLEAKVCFKSISPFLCRCAKGKARTAKAAFTRTARIAHGRLEQSNRICNTAHVDAIQHVVLSSLIPGRLESTGGVSALRFVKPDVIGAHLVQKYVLHLFLICRNMCALGVRGQLDSIADIGYLICALCRL